MRILAGLLLSMVIPTCSIAETAVFLSEEVLTVKGARIYIGQHVFVTKAQMEILVENSLSPVTNKQRLFLWGDWCRADTGLMEVVSIPQENQLRMQWQALERITLPFHCPTGTEFLMSPDLFLEFTKLSREK